MKRFAGGLAVMALLLAGCGSTGGTPEPAAVTKLAAAGVLSLHLSDSTGKDPCAGEGGYQDIQGGAQVAFYDATGKLVAAGVLQPGKPTDGSCSFAWKVDGVPVGAGPFQYEVTHRGKLIATEEQIKGFSLDSTLGS